MFKVEHKGLVRKTVRLISDSKLAPDDFTAIAAELGVAPTRARKTGLVGARKAQAAVRLETHWNGKETEIVAAPGDWLVTSLTQTGDVLRDANGHENTYAIDDAKFASLYEPASGESEFGKVFRPLGTVQALYFSGGFDIQAPWGERQKAKVGYLLLNGTDVYGNHKDTFEATYATAD